MSHKSNKPLSDTEFQMNYSHYVCEKHTPVSVFDLKLGEVSEERKALDKLGGFASFHMESSEETGKGQRNYTLRYVGFADKDLLVTYAMKKGETSVTDTAFVDK